jgi:hypothetical protein
LNSGEHGLVEKCRDAGLTWCAASFSVWMWLFMGGSSIGWGSRKETLVDKLGDPDSIFEKIRMVIGNLPRFFWPEGFHIDSKDCNAYMKIINPENGATIIGESGDNIGRGGRTTLYFKDESAHYERPEKIEASLSANTDVQIDISSVNGPGTIFYNKTNTGEIWKPGHDIKPGVTRVFIFDWTDDPRKSQEWYDTKKAKYEREGLSHIFAQEVDRDSLAAVENILIPSKWVESAVDAHIKLGYGEEIDVQTISALDVAD